MVGTGRFELPNCGRERGKAWRAKSCAWLVEGRSGAESKDLTPAPLARFCFAPALRYGRNTPWGARGRQRSRIAKHAFVSDEKEWSALADDFRTFALAKGSELQLSVGSSPPGI
jgi:hypothetical protein